MVVFYICFRIVLWESRVGVGEGDVGGRLMGGGVRRG